MRRFFSIFAGCLLSAVVYAQQPSFITDSLDSYIEQGMKDWEIPGLALAIIKDGKVLVSKGYGVRDVKSKAPVTENTLFMIASNSKLFTGTAMANLEYQRNLSLDDKVTRYLPWFRLYDATSTRLLNIRDILSHRMGTKTFQGDFVSWNSKLDEEQIIRNMALLKPTGSFRQDYGYSNSGFVTAGAIIKSITGKTWGEYVQENILTPLEMTNTYTVIEGIEKRTNVAKPYTNSFTAKLTELPYDQIDNLAAAGGLVSSVKDVSKWLMMQLDSGRYEGKQILPWEVLQKTRDINIMVNSRKDPVYPSHFAGYGLGVYISDYAGSQVYRHTGGVFGFLTSTAFIPEKNLGIAIFTNNDNQRFFEMLRLQIQDAYLDLPYVNRSKQVLAAQKERMETAKKQLAVFQARIGKEKPGLAISSYTGKYVHPLYGSIYIKPGKKGGLLVEFNTQKNLTATLDYMDSGEWLIRYDNIDYGIFPLSFEIKDGKVTSIDIKVHDFLEYDPYTFVKE